MGKKKEFSYGFLDNESVWTWFVRIFQHIFGMDSKESFEDISDVPGVRENRSEKSPGMERAQAVKEERVQVAENEESKLGRHEESSAKPFASGGINPFTGKSAEDDPSCLRCTKLSDGKNDRTADVTVVPRVVPTQSSTKTMSMLKKEIEEFMSSLPKDKASSEEITKYFTRYNEIRLDFQILSGKTRTDTKEEFCKQKSVVEGLLDRCLTKMRGVGIIQFDIARNDHIFKKLMKIYGKDSVSEADVLQAGKAELKVIDRMYKEGTFVGEYCVHAGPIRANRLKELTNEEAINLLSSAVKKIDEHRTEEERIRNRGDTVEFSKEEAGRKLVEALIEYNKAFGIDDKEIRDSINIPQSEDARKTLSYDKFKPPYDKFKPPYIELHSSNDDYYRS